MKKFTVHFTVGSVAKEETIRAERYEWNRAEGFARFYTGPSSGDLSAEIKDVVGIIEEVRSA